MDAILARYSAPAYGERLADEEQQQAIMADAMPSGLSLKFAMPPLKQVGYLFCP